MRLIQRSTFIKQAFKLNHIMDLCDVMHPTANSCLIFKLHILANLCFMIFFNIVGCFYNYKMSPAVFLYALLPRAVYATLFQILSLCRVEDNTTSGATGLCPVAFLFFLLHR